MTNKSLPLGKTTIAPEVLISIARLTTLGVKGVSHLAGSSEIGKLFKRPDLEGVRVSVQDNHVYVDLFVVMFRDVNVREVSHTIQSQVARAISEMVGMEVGKINVHVEDIDYTVVNNQ
jgi:uncharacterized alkaline shock family protein YloU